MSGGQSGYELKEAKDILSELKSIRKAISTGEKEKQDLMQVGPQISKQQNIMGLNLLPVTIHLLLTEICLFQIATLPEYMLYIICYFWENTL